MLWCLVTSITAICFLSGIADTAQTSRIVVIKSPPFTISASLLRSLHWLPVKFRVDFKICLLTFTMLHEKQPVYRYSMQAKSLPSQLRRSNKGITLSVLMVKTNTGARPFQSCSPSLWNHLLLSVHSVVHSATSTVIFRKRLRMHLLDLTFPP